MASSIPRSLTARSLGRPQCFARGPSPARFASSSSIELPPESPAYIDVPQPPQVQGRNAPIVKGILPKPKQIFSATAPNRVSSQYMSKTSPHRQQAQTEAHGRDKDFVDYKRRMTDMRKRSIREGLQQLRKREDRAIAAMAAKSSEKQRINRENIRRPQREDDRLTSPTVLPPVESLVSEPLTPKQIRQKQERWQAKEARKAEEQRNNLHTLYMNARDFIVTEEQLNAKISEVFDDPFFQNENDPSIWAKEGIPEGVSKVLEFQSSSRVNPVDGHRNTIETTRDRLQVIAEELTGGKMEDSQKADQRAGRNSGFS